jgi:hypothetical protein
MIENYPDAIKCKENIYYFHAIYKDIVYYYSFKGTA